MTFTSSPPFPKKMNIQPLIPHCVVGYSLCDFSSHPNYQTYMPFLLLMCLLSFDFQWTFKRQRGNWPLQHLSCNFQNTVYWLILVNQAMHALHQRPTNGSAVVDQASTCMQTTLVLVREGGEAVDMNTLLLPGASAEQLATEIGWWAGSNGYVSSCARSQC